MKKALILTRNFPPCVTDAASRVWKLASNLVPFGWEPVVVAPPEVSGVPAFVKSGANQVTDIYRTGPVFDAGQIDAVVRNDLLWGRAVQPRNPSFKARLSSRFRTSSDGAAWLKNAATIVEQLLGTYPDIDLLYAQGPPLEPLRLAIDVARAHSLAVVLDITEPLDPAMSRRSGTSGSSAAARAEEEILLSGLPLLTPNRTLKEYFLKKYPGQLDNGRVTIVPPVFDPLHPAFRRQEGKKMDTVLRVALFVDELKRAELKRVVSGLDMWIRTDGLVTGGVEIMLSGAGASALFRRVAKKPLEKLLLIDEVGGIDRELERCRSAGFFCAVMGSSPVNTSIVSGRIIDALGMGLPLCLIAPEGVASRLVLDAGGMWGQPGDAAGITELFRAMASAWSFGSLERPPDHLTPIYSIGAAMQALTGAIAPQPVP